MEVPFRGDGLFLKEDHWGVWGVLAHQAVPYATPVPASTRQYPTVRAARWRQPLAPI
ncbi:MAG: hypothetical protein LBU75_04275 [Desulfovibrio sp.]|nr:hypothetical protein [Desulfovibrio sp.]